MDGHLVNVSKWAGSHLQQQGTILYKLDNSCTNLALMHYAYHLYSCTWQGPFSVKRIE